MPQTHQRLICVGSADPSLFGSRDGFDVALTNYAALSDEEGWRGLLEAAASLETDDREYAGLTLKASLIDAPSGRLIESEVWVDACGDQVDRVLSYLVEKCRRTRDSDESAPRRIH